MQLKEIQREIDAYQKGLHLEPILFKTTGDIDQKTSLKQLEKTNFFTKEIDEDLLQGKVDLAIHSAKDLPENLPEGLEILAITKGIDSSDSLVFKKGLKTLPENARIGTSSNRREEAIKKLFPKSLAVDIRGTIQQRLKLLEKDLDAVIIAEAALIRLSLNPQRIKLPIKTPPLQGKLAVVARKDSPHKNLFSLIDARKS